MSQSDHVRHESGGGAGKRESRTEVLHMSAAEHRLGESHPT